MKERTILLIASIMFMIVAGNPVSSLLVSATSDNAGSSWGGAYDDIFAIPTPTPYGAKSYDDIFAIPTLKPYGAKSYDDIFAIPTPTPYGAKSYDDIFAIPTPKPSG